MTAAEWTPAREAYERLACDYDRLTEHHDYALWVGVLDTSLRRHGVGGDTLLDLGCGTGRSTAAWRDAGYRVVGVDVSEAMLARARGRLPGVALHHADLRALPQLGRFDVVSCLCDVINYIPGDELASTLASMGEVLVDDGLLVFDANTRHAYRTYFSVTEVPVDDQDVVLVWRGNASDGFRAGDTAELTIESFRRDPASHHGWLRATSTQQQHHHPPRAVRRALAEAGLRLVDVYGQGFDATPQRPLDEERDTKALYIARREAR